MSDDEFVERRMSARICGEFEISIHDGHEKAIVNTIDLSSSGLRFKSSSQVQLFREISLSFAIPAEDDEGRMLNCNAIVVRCEKCQYGEGYNVALIFASMGKSDKEALSDFLEKAMENSHKK